MLRCNRGLCYRVITLYLVYQPAIHTHFIQSWLGIKKEVCHGRTRSAL
jgi:hypothetical protein